MRNVIAEMSLAHYQGILKTTQTAILPVGATEGYGHHLPLGSDWLVTYEVARRAAAEAGCFVAPPVTYGFSEDLMCYPGTLTVSTMTIISIYRDIVWSLHRQGIKKVLFLCGHIGNVGAIDQVANDAKRELGIDVAIIDWWRFVYHINSDLMTSKFPVGHAAEVGTSVLMYLFPEFVDSSRIIVNEKEDKEEIPDLYVYEQFDKTTKSAVLGNPLEGNPEKGEKMIKKSVEIISEFLANW